MSFAKVLFCYGTWPVLFFGFGGALVWLAAADAGVLVMFAVLAGALAFSFLAEWVIPYQPDWNLNHGDLARDWLHALINTTLNRAALWLLPWLTWTAIGRDFWPHTWPFVLQVVFAALILDLGIAMAHHASHRFAPLWCFHAVHHSPKRLYGLNGLMKHPIHQAIETGSGVLPLLLLGIPFEVAITLPFLVTIALLCQHSNADYRTGWFKYFFANAEVHRFHHGNSAGGNVNFGLFTVLYDHLVGTFRYEPGAAPRGSREIGIAGEKPYPVRYWSQLTEPFRHLQ